MRLSKAFCTLIVLSFFTSCTSISMHPLNLEEDVYLDLNIGMSKSEVKSTLKKSPLFSKDEEEGIFYEFYTMDKQEQNHFYCNNLMLSYKDNHLVKAEFVAPRTAQKRCNEYARQYTNKQIQNSNAMYAFSSAYTQSLQNQTRNNSNQCINNWGCGNEQRCVKKKYATYGQCVDVYYSE